MKLTAVNNINRQNKTNSNQKNYKNNSVSFKGFADSATAFWNFVDAGGRGLQFTVEDMLGTNFPRTYKGAMAGYKYTGEINISALLQEAIREFLTGPTMTIAPIVILAAATRMTGKSANTHIENISNLSYLASTVTNNENIAKEAFQESFNRTVIKDMLTKTIGSDVKNIDEDVDNLMNGLKEYLEIQNKTGSNRAEKKELKKKSAEALEKLRNKFETIVKARKSSYKETDFGVAKYAINETKQGATDFKNYMKYMIAFGQDYENKNTANNVVDLSKNAIENFKHSWTGKRALTIISMIGLTGAIMSLIPKIYTLASGKENPNGKGVYAEAQKREGK